jgi:lipoprotein-releasing system permease protein
MYKLLLCWRYLRTRYIALASIISVTLGVATMIVVNSVMSGFAAEMQNRIHGILSDVVLEVHSLNGAPDADWHMEQIRRVAGDAIEGMTATVVVPALLNYPSVSPGQWITKEVALIGIDEATQSQVSDFSKYLQHPDNRNKMSFQLRGGGYDTRDHQGGADASERRQMKDSGWTRRKQVAEAQALDRMLSERKSPPAEAGRDRPRENPFDAGARTAAAASDDRAEGPRADATRSASPDHTAGGTKTVDPFADRRSKTDEQLFDPAKQQHTGVVLGILTASARRPSGEERFLVLPGDDVKLTFPTAGTPPKEASGNFTVVDFYECKMAEYDSKFAFVPIRTLQEMRGMIDPATGKGMFNSIQIKLKPGVDGKQVCGKLTALFGSDLYTAMTWRDKQGALLAAVQMETAILNVLLFLIIAVSGFGILAIFFMIVVEKTRDIGVLKSLGASGTGIMGIFLSYGLSLGIVGSGAGLVIGLVFVHHINDIADLLGKITGTPVFDPSIYYFYRIPTIIDAGTITWIVLGALTIAVLASILPAMRAALLHPVEALRYE